MLVQDGSNISLLVAFTGGVITFFASCLLPLVPIYLAYLSGISLSKTSTISTSKLKGEIFINGLIFTIGFIIVFVMLGATANGFGRLLNIYKPLIQTFGGIFFIFMGFFMLNLVKPVFLYKDRRIELPRNPTNVNKVNSLLVGFTFGLAWTPCIGPVLAVILFWASQAESFALGIGLLLVYGIGLGIPFLIIALFFDKLSKKISGASRIGNKLQKMMALFIIFIGILLVTNKMGFFSLQLIRIFNLNKLAL